MKELWVVLALLLAAAGSVAGEGRPSPFAIRRSAVKPVKLAVVISATGLGVVCLDRYYRTEPWWQYRTAPHLDEDDEYASSVDKAGHLFANSALTKLYYELYLWSGLSSRASAWWAFGSAVAIKGITEFGYESRGVGFGADYKDWLADVVGAGFVVVNEYVPDLGLALKMSFALRSDPPYTREHPFTNDYQAQTYWLAVDVPGVKWLALAIGVNRSTWQLNQGVTQWWLSPDVDWVELCGSHWWSRLLNSVKLPTPKMQVYPRLIIKGIAWSF